jgi:hypothetical protein
MREGRRLSTILGLAGAVALLAAAVFAAQPPSSAAAAPAAAAGQLAEPSSAAPALTLDAAAADLTAGEATRLTVRLAVPGAVVALSRRPAGAAEFSPAGELEIDPTGRAAARMLPRVTTTYRVDYAGDGVLWPSASAEITVTVRPRIGLTVTDTIYRGQLARLAITVGPVHPGGAVVVQQQRDGSWSDWRTVTLDERSRATLRWRAAEVGRRSFRVWMAADAEHAAGTSAARRVTVRRPNPYGVPVTLPRIIVVDTSQYRLYFFSFGQEVRSFPCVLGRPGLPTPTGRFRVYAKGMWPGGPFGARIMSYHSPYAIHGTNEPHLLGRFPRNFSHGCTRLGNADAIWLYDHAPVGTPVWNVP